MGTVLTRHKLRTAVVGHSDMNEHVYVPHTYCKQAIKFSSTAIQHKSFVFQNCHIKNITLT